MDLIEKLHEIINIALDGLQDLKEQADPRGQIIAKIRELTPNIVTHLYKIYGFGNQNSTTIHHWVAEISANLRSFCYTKNKATKRPLTTKEIMNVFKVKYMDASELASIESDLYPEYGYSVLDNVTLYNKIYGILPKLIDYMKSIPDTERPNIENLINLINEG